MRLSKKSEWFIFDKPLMEPSVLFYGKEYHIERVVKSNGEIVWFGLNTNWVKEKGKNWSFLTTDDNIKPDPVYPSSRSIFKECPEPIYETLYKKFYRLDKLKEII